MARELSSLNWIEELLPKGYLRKPMFGGFAYYVDNKMILALFEGENDHTYKDQTFDFELWSGCLFPTEREHHQKIIKKFPFLFPHPILSKWLYLPQQTENFEDLINSVLKEIRRRSELFGVIPKPKKSKKSKVKSKKPVRVNARRPQMFQEKTKK